MEIASRLAATPEEAFHSPGSSNPQRRRKTSEKPRTTVIAVMIPWRKPEGIWPRGPSVGMRGILATERASVHAAHRLRRLLEDRFERPERRASLELGDEPRGQEGRDRQEDL